MFGARGHAPHHVLSLYNRFHLQVASVVPEGWRGEGLPVGGGVYHQAGKNEVYQTPLQASCSNSQYTAGILHSVMVGILHSVMVSILLVYS